MHARLSAGRRLLPTVARRPPSSSGAPRTPWRRRLRRRRRADGDALVRDLDGARRWQQVLGGSRTPGVPSVQRMRHDDVRFTVTVAPARPGANLVRVDSTPLGGESRTRLPPGPGRDRRGRPRPRPSPPRHRWPLGRRRPPRGKRARCSSRTGPGTGVPFAVETGTEPADTGLGRAPTDRSAWPPPRRPSWPAAAREPRARPTASPPPTRPPCGPPSTRSARAGWSSWPSSATTPPAAARRTTSSARPPPSPGAGRRPERARRRTRNALLVVSGWADAATSLAAVTPLPMRQQPIRSDGTWLAPWLLTPGRGRLDRWAPSPARLRHPRRRRAGVQPDPGDATSPARRPPAPGSAPGARRAVASPRPPPVRRVPGGLHARGTVATQDTRRPSPGSRAAPSPRSARPRG